VALMLRCYGDPAAYRLETRKRISTGAEGVTTNGLEVSQADSGTNAERIVCTRGARRMGMGIAVLSMGGVSVERGLRWSGWSGWGEVFQVWRSAERITRRGEA